jgi:cobalt-zinc-cadmium efflux system protein
VSGGHSHGAPGPGQRRALSVVLGISAAILAAEVTGAFLSGSLALLADAGHMLSDVAGLGLALAATVLAARPATDTRTWGYLRAEVLAAAAQAAVLLAVGGFVLAEAIRRLITPPEVVPGIMVVFGVIALAGWTRADPVASLVIAALIIPRTIKLLCEAVRVLMEVTPKDVDLAQVRAHILAVEHVHGVHDLHATAVASTLPVLTAHVVVDDSCFEDRHLPTLLDQLQQCLAGHFDVEHSTFQFEPGGHAGHEHATHP